MNPDPKSVLMTLKLTQEQFDWIDQAAQFISTETGCDVSHGSIVMRLMENGLPAFEKELEQLRSKNNQSSRRFHKLELVYTRIDTGT